MWCQEGKNGGPNRPMNLMMLALGGPSGTSKCSINQTRHSKCMGCGQCLWLYLPVLVAPARHDKHAKGFACIAWFLDLFCPYLQHFRGSRILRTVALQLPKKRICCLKHGQRAQRTIDCFSWILTPPGPTKPKWGPNCADNAGVQEQHQHNWDPILGCFYHT